VRGVVKSEVAVKSDRIWEPAPGPESSNHPSKQDCLQTTDATPFAPLRGSVAVLCLDSSSPDEETPWFQYQTADSAPNLQKGGSDRHRINVGTRPSNQGWYHDPRRRLTTISVTAYRGNDHLIDCAATKGAIVAVTRSLAISLAERGIRVNGVAPGPAWTQLVEFSSGNVPLKRAGQPEGLAQSSVFLASADSTYITGQLRHPNGGEIING
jgi:NAD(P)-dependent dehydrogenase (short-subunit alcohol dehydrogenase family)